MIPETYHKCLGSGKGQSSGVLYQVSNWTCKAEPTTKLFECDVDRSSGEFIGPVFFALLFLLSVFVCALFELVVELGSVSSSIEENNVFRFLILS